MNRFILIVPLLLAACSSQPEPAPYATYKCPGNIDVMARYPDPNTADIMYKGERHILKLATSASGARYVGDGLQWWTKGQNKGYLSGLAAHETMASADSAECFAVQRMYPVSGPMAIF